MYCRKKFVTSAALKKHKKDNHFGHQMSVCTKCNEILDNNKDLKNHKEVCGKDAVGVENKREKSKEVCIHWRRGKCDRGSQCNFSHVGWQDSPSQKHRSTRMTPEPCRNGPKCNYFAKGKCNFGHHMTRHQPVQQNYRSNLPRDGGQSEIGREQSDRGRGQSDSGRARCKFGSGCDRVVNCPFIHSLEDFPHYNNHQGFRGTKRSRNNRN